MWKPENLITFHPFSILLVFHLLSFSICANIAPSETVRQDSQESLEHSSNPYSTTIKSVPAYGRTVEEPNNESTTNVPRAENHSGIPTTHMPLVLTTAASASKPTDATTPMFQQINEHDYQSTTGAASVNQKFINTDLSNQEHKISENAEKTKFPPRRNQNDFESTTTSVFISDEKNEANEKEKLDNVPNQRAQQTQPPDRDTTVSPPLLLSTDNKMKYNDINEIPSHFRVEASNSTAQNNHDIDPPEPVIGSSASNDEIKDPSYNSSAVDSKIFQKYSEGKGINEPIVKTETSTQLPNPETSIEHGTSNKLPSSTTSMDGLAHHDLQFDHSKSPLNITFYNESSTPVKVMESSQSTSTSLPSPNATSVPPLDNPGDSSNTVHQFFSELRTHTVLCLVSLLLLLLVGTIIFSFMLAIFFILKYCGIGLVKLCKAMKKCFSRGKCSRKEGLQESGSLFPRCDVNIRPYDPSQNERDMY